MGPYIGPSLDPQEFDGDLVRLASSLPLGGYYVSNLECRHPGKGSRFWFVQTLQGSFGMSMLSGRRIIWPVETDRMLETIVRDVQNNPLPSMSSDVMELMRSASF